MTPSMDLEQGNVIITHPGYHCEVIPVIAEYPLHPHTESITQENLHTPLPIECVVGLPEAKEYFLEDLPLH